MRLLLDSGADIEQEDRNGYTALTWAAVRGTSNRSGFCYKSGAYVDHRTQSGETALLRASQAGFPDIVKLLVKNAQR